MREERFSFTHPALQHWMEVRGQLHAPAALLSAKGFPYPLNSRQAAAGAGLHAADKIKKKFLCREPNHNSSVHRLYNKRVILGVRQFNSIYIWYSLHRTWLRHASYFNYQITCQDANPMHSPSEFRTNKYSAVRGVWPVEFSNGRLGQSH